MSFCLFLAGRQTSKGPVPAPHVAQIFLYNVQRKLGPLCFPRSDHINSVFPSAYFVAGVVLAGTRRWVRRKVRTGEEAGWIRAGEDAPGAGNEGGGKGQHHRGKPLVKGWQ